MIEDKIYTSGFINEYPSTNPNQKEIVRWVKEQGGKPCVSGGDGPVTFDSSGLAYYCHDKKIPRKSNIQAKSGIPFHRDELKTGDLMFGNIDGDGTISLITFYIGEGRMIYASGPGERVKESDSSSNCWDPKYVTARRYWN